MMKKFLATIILPLAIVSMSSCVLYNGRNKDGSPKGETSSTAQPTTQTPTSGSEPTSTTTTGTSLPPAPQGNVNLYLVLGPTGMWEGAKQPDFPSKYLENTYTGVFKIGDDLPKEDKVTSEVNGTTFSHWVNRETTEIVTKVPEVDSILIAVFDNGEGGNRPQPSVDIPEEGFGFLFAVEGDEQPRYALGTLSGKDYQGRDQYKIENMTFYENERFQLYDFKSKVGWTVKLEDACLGGHVDEYLNRNEATKYYEVKKTFKAKDIYIKLAYENDELYMGLDE